MRGKIIGRQAAQNQIQDALKIAPMAVFGLILGGCATLPSDSAARAEVEQLNDPFEAINRETYAFNTKFRNELEPARKELSGNGPAAAIWGGVHNALVNLREPLVFANDLAQGKECAAGASLRRFMINSTLGAGGIFDIAKTYGVSAHDNDLGTTFGVWGVPSGPYMMLPVIGPSDIRGTVGIAGEYFLDPVDIGLVRAGAAEVV